MHPDMLIMLAWRPLAPIATVWYVDEPSPLRMGVAFLLILYASVFVHELGHALMGRAAGFLVTAFGSGTSRPVCVIRIKGVRLYASLIRPFQGVTWAFQIPLYPSKRQTISFAVGGILANSLAALIGLFVWWFWPAAPFEIGLMTIINGWLALINLVPYQLRIGQATVQNDGMLILKALRSQTTASLAPTTIQVARYFRGLLTAIGDTIMLRTFLLMAADAWSDLDDPEMADAALAEAAEVADPERPAIHAFEATTRAKVALGAGRLDETGTELDLAESYYEKESHEAGLFRVAVLRTCVALARKDFEGAQSAYAEWEFHPLITRVPALRISTIVLSVTHAIERTDASAVAKLMAEYDVYRHFGPSAARDLKVHSAVARFYAGLGDTEAAETAYRQALTEVRKLASAWSDKADRTRFLDRRSSLIAEIQAFFETTGKAEEAETLLRGLGSTPAVVSDDRERRLVRAGLWMLVVNVAVSAGSMVAGLTLEGSIGRTSLVAGSVLSFFTIATALYVGIHLALSRWLSIPRFGTGRMILLLAGLPWMIVITFFVTLYTTPRPNLR